MAAAISPTAGQRYGIQRVCRLWDVPRSSFYAAQAPASALPAAPPTRRGPKCARASRPADPKRR
jgi:putative transposase